MLMETVGIVTTVSRLISSRIGKVTIDSPKDSYPIDFPISAAMAGLIGANSLVFYKPSFFNQALTMPVSKCYRLFITGCIAYLTSKSCEDQISENTGNISFR